MSRLDTFVCIILFFLAIFIWLRDTAWSVSGADTLPILIAIPLFYWIGRPWRLTVPVHQLPVVPLVVAALLILAGIVTDFTLLLAIGWCYLLWTWLSRRTPEEDHDRIRKLLIMPLMAFPWVTLDAQPVGWWFRLTGASVTGYFYSLLGFDVKIEGTNLLINGLPISVEAACSGLNTLQSMLIAGSALAFLFLGKTNRYWWNLPLLVIIAWVANTIRVIVISGVGLAYGAEFALGAFHTWGGWLVLIVMFLLCWLAFQLQEPKMERK